VPPRVFISSTSIDLQDYRQAAFRAIHALGGYADDMIFWSADERDGATVSTDRVRQSDVLILLLAHRYGYVPDGASYSVTEMEFRAAREAKVPVLAFVLDEDVPWPPKFVERERAAELSRFKAAIDKEVTRRTFRSPDELMALVTQSLVALASRPSERSRGSVVFEGSARLISSAAELRSTPDASVLIGSAEDGLPSALEIRRSEDVASLLDSIARVVARPGVEPPVAIFKTFQQAIEQHSRRVWAGDRVFSVETPGGPRLMYVSRSTLSTLFRPLWAAILGPHVNRGTVPARLDITSAVLSFARPRSGPAPWRSDMMRDGSSDELLQGTRELQSVGGRNRFLGISLDDGSVRSVGVQDDRWVEWRPFYFESLAASFPNGRFELRRRGSLLADIEGALEEYVESLEHEAPNCASDDGVVELTSRFVVSRQDAGQTLLAIAELVRESHQRGRIHGDLKASNVVLTPDRPTLIDDFDLKEGELAPGWTPDWSSPEQVLGNPVTPATDVYPLGVMVVQLLGGRLVGEVRKFKTAPLADGRDEFDIFYDPFVHLDSNQTTVTGQGLGPWLALARNCLAFDPARRIKSAAQFVEQLRALLEKYPLQGGVGVTAPGTLAIARLPDGSQRVIRLLSDAGPASDGLASGSIAAPRPRSITIPGPPPPITR
jgi:hypothetical protein